MKKIFRVPTALCTAFAAAQTLADWHSHAQGQYLIVTEGTGRFQEWGKPVQTIKKGDVV